MVNCVGQPPFAGTVQILLRPLILVTNAICLPSGDQVLPPMARVVYSLSIAKACMSTTVWLLSLVGSAMAAGAGRADWAKAAAVRSNKVATRALRIPPKPNEGLYGAPAESFKFRVSSFD